MPGFIGSVILPTILEGTALFEMLGPTLTSALGGGLGSALGGGDFMRGAAGGLAGGAFDALSPEISGALGGLGGYAPTAMNALRGALVSGVGGGDPLQGALFGGLMGTEAGKSISSSATNALRSVAGLDAKGAPGGIDAAESAWLNNGTIPGQQPAQSAAIPSLAQRESAWLDNGTIPGAQQAGGAGNYFASLMKPEVIVPAAANFGMGMYQAAQAKDMANKQLALAREMDTGLGLRKQAAGFAMNPDSIAGSPGYQASMNEQRRQLNRLASARGMLNSGQLPAALSSAAEQQMGDWYRYYTDTANRGGNVPYPNYQNMLRTL